MSPLPFNLDALEDEARLERFAVLVDWVGWLTEHYGLARLIPSCWWRHAAMVEELNALEASWSSAYEGDGTDTDAPLRWHEDFAKVRERLAEWDRQGCAAQGHRDRTSPARAREQPQPQAAAEADTGRRLTAALRPVKQSQEAFPNDLFAPPPAPGTWDPTTNGAGSGGERGC